MVGHLLILFNAEYKCGVFLFLIYFILRGEGKRVVVVKEESGKSYLL